MRNGKELVQQGYVQLSRRYRMVGMVKDPLERLKEVVPYQYSHIMEQATRQARDYYLRVYARGEPEKLELTVEEFEDYYRALHGHGTKGVKF